MNITNNTQSLKRNNDFRRVYRRGKKFAGGYVVVYAFQNRCDYNRVGLTVSKTVGNAVVRSRVKRLLRESYRSYAKQIPTNMDFVIVARSSIANKSLLQITKDLGYALRKLGLLKV